MRRALALLVLTGAFAGAATVIDLQPYRQSSSIHFKSEAGKEGTATLVNLNPAVNAWYLLALVWNGSPQTAWHLENAKPRTARLVLDEKYPAGLMVVEGGKRYPCDLFKSPDILDRARSSQVAYYPLCEGKVFLRNPAKGHRTALETAAEFLRDEVWGGEQVVDVFHHLLADRYRETGDVQSSATPEAKVVASDRPLAAMLNPAFADRRLTSAELGIALAEGASQTPGTWSPVASTPGAWVSLLQPGYVSQAILQSYGNLVNNLDSVEAASLGYLIAFDLDQFDLAYALGTEHPEVNWSDRVTGTMRAPALPGPDGIGNIAPLISTGLIRPDIGRITVAAFTGGFKRSHGAFKFGELAQKNHGSHYGFIESGVVFSKLQPGLATVFVLDNGFVGMKTWTEADNAFLPRVRHARQNGVPLIEAGAPGRLVAQWGAGNWSGSENEKLRSIRAGLALQTTGSKRFLIYAVFSDATPSAMARVFEAYRTNYAMLLDMNALEHTYLALYRRSGSELSVDHLLKGMSQLDKSASNENVPRFLGYSDNRDFFYLTRRNAREVKP